MGGSVNPVFSIDPPGSTGSDNTVAGPSNADNAAKFEIAAPDQQPTQPSSFMDTVTSALKGGAKGAAAGLGVPDTDNPLHDWFSALNDQVNQIATYPWAKGGPLYETMATMAHGLVSSGKAVVGALPEMLEASRKNDVEGFYKAASKGITSALLLKGMVNPEVEPATLGMTKGGLTAQVERIANRIPLASMPLNKVYGEVASRFNDTVADAVSKSSGIKADPTDLVGSLNDGADAIKSQAKAAYPPVDAHIKVNQNAFVSAAIRNLNTLDPELAKNISGNFVDNPISDLKVVRDNLDRKIGSLINTNRGMEAQPYIAQMRTLDTTMDNIARQLPPPIKASYDLGQSLWAKQAAMRETADTFDKSISGLPPGKQPSGLAKVPQQLNAQSLVDALKDEPSLRRAFGDNVADAIIQHSHRLSMAQSLKGGAGNAAGIVGGIYGTSLLARAAAAPFVGGAAISTIPLELTGIYALSKVLSNQAALPAYANMLKATSTTAQDYYARQAVGIAMGKGQPPIEVRQYPQGGR